ncbi:MAG: hypothetical protein U0892_20525 [Pirellulales bacterium]
MSAALEPVTRQKLHQFRRRQRMLWGARGTALCAAISISALAGVVIVDAGIVLSEPVRWLLSGLLYLTAIVSGIIFLRRLWAGEPLTETAAAFESREPQLHERLLPAVELSDDYQSQIAGSVGFRAALQKQVAQLVSAVKVSKLLPWSLIARSLAIGLVVTGVFFALMFVPGLHLPQRVARALFPAANLGRISRYHIEIVKPDSPEVTLPAGDVSSVVASVTGPEPDLVTLEAKIDGEEQRINMRLASPDQLLSLMTADQAENVNRESSNVHFYLANLSTEAETIDYRVAAEDAYTPWQRIRTRPRPKVESFKKTIIYPAYAGLPNLVVKEDHGDIKTLKGSRVELDIQVDQAVRSAVMKIDEAGQSQSKMVELYREKDDAPSKFSGVHADLAIESEARYRVDVEAAETGFTNAFSSVYRIEPIEDQAPQLAWHRPQGAMVVCEPNQITNLEWQFKDELPLASVELVVRKGVDADVVTALTAPDTEQGTISHDFDLLPLKAKIGDMFSVSLRATDRKGQSSQSAPLEVVITSISISPERRPATEQRIEIATKLHELTEKLEEDMKKIRELTDQVQRAPQESKSVELQEIASRVSTATEEKAAEIRAAVVQAIKEPQDSVSQAELERVGLTLSRVETAIVPQLKSTVEKVAQAAQQADPKSEPALKQTRESAAHLRHQAEQLWDASRTLDRRFREFTAHDVLSEMARSLFAVQSYQDEVVRHADETPPETLKREQAVVARQLRELEQAMVDRSPLLREGTSGGLRGWIEWAGQTAERVERATNDREENINFKEFTKQIKQEVDSRQQVFNIDGGLSGEINNGRKELDSRSGTAAQPIDELAKNAVRDMKTKPQEAKQQLQAGRAELLDHLQHRKALEQSRTDADTQLVNDLGSALRAAKDTLSDSDLPTDKAVEQLQGTAAAIKKLEAVHNVNEAAKHLVDLEQIERWEPTSVEARVEAPRTWDAFNERLEQASRAVRESGIDPKLADELDRLRWSPDASRAGQKISTRRWSNESKASAAAEVTTMQEQLDTARAKLADAAAQARKDLGQFAPSVPELAHRAAEETRKLQKETEKLKDAAQAGEVPDIKPRMDQLAADQAKASEPMQDLREALGDLAGVQNVLDKQQRDTARDADTSAKIVQQASEQIDTAMQSAKQAPAAQEAAAPLGKAADAEQRAADALDKIAAHFEQLQSNETTPEQMADARAQLSELASEVDMAGMDEWYKNAEMLADLTGMDPEKALKRLEQELGRNPRMREELSDISKQAVNESLENLKYSANQENNLRSQLEQSDPTFFDRKSLLQQDLQGASDRVRQLMQQLTSDAGSASARASQRDLQKQLENLQTKIQEAARGAEQASTQNPLEEMQRTAQQLNKTLQSAREELTQMAQKLDELATQQVHPNEQDLKNRKREMEDWQRRVQQQQARGAVSVQRSQDQRQRQTENELKQAEQAARTAQKEVDDAKNRLNSKPDNPSFKQQVADAEARSKTAQENQDRLKSRLQAVQDRTERAKKMAEEIGARKPEDLNQPQPTAEFAGRLAKTAANTAAEIARDLEQSLADTGWTEQLSAAQAQLQSSQQNQQVVEGAVTDVSENLGRAARHEERLERPAAAAQLAQQSAQVGETARGEVHTATDQLAEAAQEAKASAENQGQPADRGRASPTQSKEARNAISTAEQSIRSRAADLAAMLAGDRPQEKPLDPNQGAQEAPASPSVPIDPKMMARMLDELDRAMSQSAGSQQQQQQQSGNQQQQPQTSQNGQPQDDNNQNSNQQSSQQGGQQSKPTTTMQEAARQLAQQMNRNRQQNSQSTASSRMSSNSADTDAAPPTAVRVMGVERKSSDEWGKLREQAADQTLESSRTTVAPQYRQQVETYFRILSERSQRRESR